MVNADYADSRATNADHADQENRIKEKQLYPRQSGCYPRNPRSMLFPA
jgi:hypothetical protein